MRRNFKRALLLILLFAALPLYSQERRGGSQIYEELRVLEFSQREIIIKEEVLKGNLPDFLKEFVAISFRAKDAYGTTHIVKIFVKSDYLAVGTDQDYFTTPLGPITAQQIADSLNASLPTSKIVNLIWHKAGYKLEPFNYIPRGNRNETVDLIYDHSKVLQAQLHAAKVKLGTLVAGGKKDLVISSKLSDSTRKHHVTIYGWHRTNGKAIQPMTNIHINIYVDYSHGVRLVSNRVFVDGKLLDYRYILQDPKLYSLLSDESAPLKRVSYLPESR